MKLREATSPIGCEARPFATASSATQFDPGQVFLDGGYDAGLQTNMAQEYKLILSISATISTPRQLICQQLRAAGALRASVTCGTTNSGYPAVARRHRRGGQQCYGKFDRSAAALARPSPWIERGDGLCAGSIYEPEATSRGRTPDSERSEEETTDATSPGRVFRDCPNALRLWYCRRGKGRYCPSGNVCWTVPAAVAGIENGDERLL
jgi:hypothetical protein